MIDIVRSQSMSFLDKDFRELGLFIIKFDGELGIIRCRHNSKDDTIRLLRSIKKVNDFDVEVETLGTSGTIKALERKHMSK